MPHVVNNCGGLNMPDLGADTNWRYGPYWMKDATVGVGFKTLLTT